MKIDLFKTPTQSNPLVGVKFEAADELKIEEAAHALADIDNDMVSIIRSALAREIVWLFEISDWTDGETELARQARLSNAMIAYQATYQANVIRAFLQQVANKVEANPLFHAAAAKLTEAGS